MNKLLSILALVLVFACTKGPGPGGRAEIKGKVFAKRYNASITMTDSGYLGGEKVYIIYGDEQAVSDDIETNDKGEYTFNYLRPGTYRLYVYSSPLQIGKFDTAVVQEVEISSRNEIKELPDFKIDKLN